MIRHLHPNAASGHIRKLNIPVNLRCIHCESITIYICLICQDINSRNQYQKQSEEKNGMAITSLVMGILSLVTCCCGWIALVLGILGIIFAILSRGEDSMCSQAKAGLILSIIGVSIAILVIIAYIGLQMLSIIPDTF